MQGSKYFGGIHHLCSVPGEQSLTSAEGRAREGWEHPSGASFVGAGGWSVSSHQQSTAACLQLRGIGMQAAGSSSSDALGGEQNQVPLPLPQQ